MGITRKEFNNYIPERNFWKETVYSRILDLLTKNPDTAYNYDDLLNYLGYEKIKNKSGDRKGLQSIYTAIRKLDKNKYIEIKRPYIINKR